MKIPFFSKRIEEKKAAAEALRQSVIEQFEEKIQEADKCVDPGERVLKLQAVADSVDAAVAELTGDAEKSAKTKERLLFWTAMPAGIAASAIYPPALIGLLGMGASVFGGSKLSSKFGQAAKNRTIQKEKPFLDALEGIKNKALTQQDTLVIQDGPGIAKSKHFGDILANVPRLRAQFAAAYGRKMVEEEANKQAAPAAKKRWMDDPDSKF